MYELILAAAIFDHVESIQILGIDGLLTLS